MWIPMFNDDSTDTFGVLHVEKPGPDFPFYGDMSFVYDVVLIVALIWLSQSLLQAVIVRPLSSVSSLVRFAEEPQMFAVEFNDGCPVHVWNHNSFSIFSSCSPLIVLRIWFASQVYASTFRDSLLAAVRDVLQTEVGRCAISWIIFRVFTCLICFIIWFISELNLCRVNAQYQCYQG